MWMLRDTLHCDDNFLFFLPSILSNVRSQFLLRFCDEWNKTLSLRFIDCNHIYSHFILIFFSWAGATFFFPVIFLMFYHLIWELLLRLPNISSICSDNFVINIKRKTNKNTTRKKPHNIWRNTMIFIWYGKDLL